MKTPSIRAQVADLVGEDILAVEFREERRIRPAPLRLPLALAVRTCPRLALIAALDGEREVAVGVLADGSAVVLPDSCPHDGGLLSDGFIEGDRIVCARHGWEFDARSGQCGHRPDLRLDSVLVSPSAAAENAPTRVLAKGSGPVEP